MMRLLAVGAALLALLGAVAAIYVTGQRSGVAQERAVWVERERVRDDAVAVAQRNQAAAMDRLNAEVEALRAQPERIRTVTKVLRVEADKECASLPASWATLWNAE